MEKPLSPPKFKLFKTFEESKYSYDFEDDTMGNVRVTQRSKIGSNNIARHYSLSTVSWEHGTTTGVRLTRLNYHLVAERIGKVNDSELFVIPQSLLTGLPAATKKISPEEITHILTGKEKSFTATGDKLHFHWPIFQKFKDTGYGSIIRATMTNHQVCSSKCEYCSTIARNKADSIELKEATDFIEALDDEQAAFNQKEYPAYNRAYKALTGSDIKLRGLILSGGGQPNLWPHFTEFVKYLSVKSIDVGLITNGFPEKLDPEIYRAFAWIRISITPPTASAFYKQGKFENQYLPPSIINNPKLTVGLSYVYGPWTSDEELLRLDQFAIRNNFNYVRLLTDCNLSRDAQLMSHFDLSRRLQKLQLIDARGEPLSKIFHQLKYHATEVEANQVWDAGQCFLQVYNTFWDTTGHADNGKSHCYPCDSVTVLAEAQENSYLSSERRFNAERWGTVHNTQVSDLYRKRVKPYFDPREQCKACLFINNNKTAKGLVTGTTIPIIHSPIEHINFP
jgi:hypothetical protein